ncbi:unnamed protein product [Pylaiella littoralis]
MGGADSLVWAQGHGRSASVGSSSAYSADLISHGSLAGAPLPTLARSPLGARVVQGPLQRHQQHQQHRSLSAMDLEHLPPISLGRGDSGSGSSGLLPPPLRVSPAPPGLGGANGSGGESDWLAVQQAFGSPASALHMPPSVVVPTSPTDGQSTAAEVLGTADLDSPLQRRARRSPSTSSLVLAASAAAFAGGAGGNGLDSSSSSSSVDSVAVGGGLEGGGGRGGNMEQRPVGSCDSDDGGSSRESKQQIEGHAGAGNDERDGSLTEELLKMQKQIEAMLERHSKSLEGKIGETEQVISARLALLETKVHGLEVSSPLQA